MAHSLIWSKRLFRELPRDPQVLRDRPRTYADATFLDLFFPWLDELIYNNPREALGYALVAPDLALATPEEPTPDGRRKHRSCLVRAWVSVASALRATSRHDESSEAYGEALKLIVSESIDPLIVADVNRRLSYLRACQSRHDEALELASRAVDTIREIEGSDSSRFARMLIAKGYALTGFKRYEEALLCFAEALASAGKLDKKSAADMRLHDAICNNLAAAISLSSNPDLRSALALVQRAKKATKGGRRFLPRYRVLWVEGLIWARAGSYGRAEKLLEMAHEGFTALRLPYETGLTALDLGEIYQLHGDWQKLEPMARKTYKLFELLASNTSAIRALLQWRDAVIARKLTEKITATARLMIEKKIAPGGCCKTRKRGPT